MQAYRVETTIQQDGSLVLYHLPLQAGEVVEVIILVRTPPMVTHNPYPLRGTLITYHDPTRPVAEANWEASE